VLPQVLDLIGEETIVFEVGSTKAPICKVVAMHPKKKKFYSDTSHCGNRVFRTFSSNSRIEGKTNIICEVERTAFKLQEKALELLLWE
jgi:prephenate dehydrogenase